MNKVTVKEVSDYLGIGQSSVRFLLEKEKFPFGTAARKDGGKRYVFIDRNLWEKYKKGELAYATKNDEFRDMTDGTQGI